MRIAELKTKNPAPWVGQHCVTSGSSNASMMQTYDHTESAGLSIDLSVYVHMTLIQSLHTGSCPTV